MPQSYLDEFIEIEVEKREEKVEAIGEVEEGRVVVEEFKESGRSEEISVIADIKDPEHKSRCPYCGEWVGKLHDEAM